MQDFRVGEGFLRDAEFGGDILDDFGDVGIGVWGAVALFVLIPAGAGFLAVTSKLDQFIGDRQLAIIGIFRGAPSPSCPAAPGR